MTLVPCDPALCPTCGNHVETGQWDQPALLRHGGYGARRRTTVRWCPNCTWALVALTQEARP